MDIKNKEITRFRGDTYPIIATIKENGLPVDLSGAVAKMTIAFKDSPSVTIVGTILVAAEGSVKFDFAPDVVDNVGKFFYDIQVDSGGYKTTYVKNIINFVQDVTFG